jgi:hypothetical protein
MKKNQRTKSVPHRGANGRLHPVGVQWDPATAFKVPIPRNETARLAGLRRYQILDTPPEPDFDHLTHLAALICDAPIALLSLVDSHRVWFKSKVGIQAQETSRNIALCAFAILEPDLFVIRDAAADQRFAQNPLVASRPRIRFYAGAPLVSPENHALGTLCVIDRKPRVLNRKQLEALRLLSRVAMSELEWRRQSLSLRHALRQSRLREQMWRQTAKAAGATKT